MKRRLAVGLIAAALICASAAGPAQENPHDPPPIAAELFEAGRRAMSAGDYAAAVRSLYASLEKLRAEGRGNSVDAGMVASALATSLEKLDHAQTEQAWLLAFTLLERAENPQRFIDAAQALLTRMTVPERTEEGDKIVYRLVRRIEHENVSDDDRIGAMNVATAFFRTTGQKERADALMLSVALKLRGQSALAREIRGASRARQASVAFKEGDVATFEAEVDAAIDDLRSVSPDSIDVLGLTLMLKSRHMMQQGVYAAALPVAREAADALSASAGTQDRYREARIIQIRLLDRMGRNREALALTRELIARYEASADADPTQATLLRLMAVEMMSAGERTEAREQLEVERERMKGVDDKLAWAFFFDRLADIRLAENDYSGAVRAAEDAIAIFREAGPGQDALILEPMRKRATASDGVRDRGLADRAHRELIDLSTRLFHPAHPEFARDLDAYASFLESEGRLAEAYGMRQSSIAALERAYGPQGMNVAYALNNLASLLEAAGEHEEAVRVLERAIAIVDDKPEAAHRRVMMKANLANSLVSLGRADEALAIIESAREEKSTDAMHQAESAGSLDMVAMMALANLGRSSEAYDKGREVVGRAPSADRRDAGNLLAVRLQMATLAQTMGDDRLALAETARAADLMATGRIDTDRRWRALAETTLPSLWRLGRK